MRKLCAVLALLLPLNALAGPDGGPDLIDCRRAILTPAGSNEPLLVEGGVWLSDAELLRQAKERAGLRTANAYLEAHASDVPAQVILGVALGGLLLGAATTFIVLQTVKR